MKRKLTPEQEAQRDARRASFAGLVKQVGAMSDTERAEYAARYMVVTCDQHVLSLHNQILVALQDPTATIVGGFQQWRKQGRQVSKGTHGLMIWIPRTDKKDESETQAPDTDRTHFFMGYVFDVAQTEAVPA